MRSLILVIALAGCAPALRAASAEVPKAATPAVADSSLKVLEDPHTRERIATVLATPELQRAMADVAHGFGRGALAALSDDELVARVRDAIAELARVVVAASARELERVARDVAAAAMRGMSDELGPRVAAFVRSPEVQGALGDASREIAKNAVIGSNAALSDLAQQKHAGPLGGIGDFFASRTWLIVLIAVGVVFAGLVAWLVRTRVAARRYRERNERRVAEATALIRAIEACPEQPISHDILTLLKKEFAIDGAAEASQTH